MMILQTTVSGIPLVLGLITTMLDANVGVFESLYLGSMFLHKRGPPSSGSSFP